MKQLIARLTTFMKTFAIGYTSKWLIDNKESNIIKLNKEFNVPIFNEHQEGEFLEMVYDFLVKMVSGIKDEK